MNGQTRVLQVLQQGGRYSTIDLTRLAMVADPKREVSRLRAKGYKIVDEWVKGKYARFKVWHLETD